MSGKKAIDRVSFLKICGGSCPDEVREGMLDEICKMTVESDVLEGRAYMDRTCNLGQFDCLLRVWPGKHYIIGNAARGLFSSVEISNDLGTIFSGSFLADVAIAENKPSKSGSLIKPLF